VLLRELEASHVKPKGCLVLVRKSNYQLRFFPGIFVLPYSRIYSPWIACIVENPEVAKRASIRIVIMVHVYGQQESISLCCEKRICIILGMNAHKLELLD